MRPLKLTLIIRTKLAAAILGGGCSEKVFCWPSTAPVVSTRLLTYCPAYHGTNVVALVNNFGMFCSSAG